MSDIPFRSLCIGERAYFNFGGYRFISIVADWSCAQRFDPLCEVGPEFGRVVVCEQDRDCPQFERFDYRCI